jgi:hypothetical protein
MNRASDLTYFTHEVDGRLYGGWYRLAANSTVELYARGQVRKAKLGKLSVEARAGRMLEEIVRMLEGQRARLKTD